MSDLHISWDEYRSKTEDLAKQIHKDGWQFNQVVCIAKGGMRVGDVMARIFDVPLAILSVESYKGEGVKNKRGAITFSRDLAKTSPNIGSKVLIVDDLADSGITLKKLSLIHISEPTRRRGISYAVFCLKKNFQFQKIKNKKLLCKRVCRYSYWHTNYLFTFFWLSNVNTHTKSNDIS